MDHLIFEDFRNHVVVALRVRRENRKVKGAVGMSTWPKRECA